MSREQHVQAVASAQAMVEELQSMLGMALEKADETVDAIADAIGNSDRPDAANALNQTAATRDHLPRMISNLAAAIGSLRDYAGGM